MRGRSVREGRYTSARDKLITVINKGLGSYGQYPTGDGTVRVLESGHQRIVLLNLKCIPGHLPISNPDAGTAFL
jgi:hypothetical protein